MNYSKWMETLNDDHKISSISIPGTHDSCALYDHGTFWFTQCQTKTIPEQLQMGIRFLDLRVALKLHGKTFQINHGGYDQYIDLRKVQEQVVEFLDENPTEFVLMHIQMSPQSDSNDFTVAFNELLSEPVQRPKKIGLGGRHEAVTPVPCTEIFKDYWLLDERIPTVKDARKKMVLIRAYDHALTKDAGWKADVCDSFKGVLGVPCNGFKTDGLSTNEYCATQNFWTETWDKKVPHVKSMLKDQDKYPDKFIFNWTSTAGGKAGTPWHSMGKNEDILKYLQQRKVVLGYPLKDRIGVMIADYAEYYPDFVPCIIANNIYDDRAQTEILHDLDVSV